MENRKPSYFIHSGSAFRQNWVWLVLVFLGFVGWMVKENWPILRIFAYSGVTVGVAYALVFCGGDYERL